MIHVPLRMSIGGMKAPGILNLLGRPELGSLDLLIREAAQNAWDARLPEANVPVEFRLRVRTLNAREAKVLRNLVLTAEAQLCPRDLAELAESGDEIHVLEVCDFGTVGLRGPTDPLSPIGGSDARFINFFYDYGKAHAESNDGGTFGYGRSSLYLAGKARMILVDSLTAEVSGTSRRRFMASHVGDDFEIPRGANRGRYSGIHLWVAEGSSPESPSPLEGAAAARLSKELGMIHRADGRPGTSILIPWIDPEEYEPDKIVPRLLHHLWPKMVPVDGRCPMRFHVEVAGVEYKVPDPVKHPVYRLHAQALQLVRTKDEKQGVMALRTLRPQHVTGHLSIVTGVVAEPGRTSTNEASSEEEDETEFDGHSGGSEPLDRVVLMRPAELVVRYHEIPGTSLGADTRWVAVFVCSDAPAVRTAFALAEPPAHDHWHSDRLASKSERIIVGKTMRDLIPDAVRDRLGIGKPTVTGKAETATSLAAASARFSELLLSGPGSLPGEESIASTDGKRGVPKSRGSRVRAVVPTKLDVVDGRRRAVFQVEVSGPVGATVCIGASPRVVAEGRLEELPGGVGAPRIIGADEDDAEESRFLIELLSERDKIEVVVEFGGDYAIDLACRVLEDDVK